MQYWDWGEYYVRSQLSFGLDGEVWCADDTFYGHVFDGSGWSEVSCPDFFHPTAFGVDPQGSVWCCATRYDSLADALYRLDGSEWVLVTDDGVLEDLDGARSISFDEAGNVWLVGYARLAVVDDERMQGI